jgi:hypothetical protein
MQDLLSWKSRQRNLPRGPLTKVFTPYLIIYVLYSQFDITTQDKRDCAIGAYSEDWQAMYVLFKSQIAFETKCYHYICSNLT